MSEDDIKYITDEISSVEKETNIENLKCKCMIILGERDGLKEKIKELEEEIRVLNLMLDNR